MTDKSQQLNCPMVELQSWSSSTALSMQRSMDKLEVNTAFVRTGKRCEWIISLGIIVGPMVRIYLTAIVGISHKHKMRLNRPERFRVFHFVIAEDIRYTDVTTTRSKCNRCFFFFREEGEEGGNVVVVVYVAALTGTRARNQCLSQCQAKISRDWSTSTSHISTHRMEWK